MPQTISLSTDKPEFDGLIDIHFTGEDGTDLWVRGLDAAAEHEDLLSTLAKDGPDGSYVGGSESKGVPFSKAVQRFIAAKYLVDVNLPQADRFYRSLTAILRESESFFLPPPESPGTTEST